MVTHAHIGRKGPLLALALLLGLGWTPTLRAEAATARTIVFFGDSLSAGYGLPDPDAQSYPADIQAKIDSAHLRWHVVNAGLSGDTSAGGLRRVDWVLNQKVDVFVLELGANDGLRGTAPSFTEANLQEIIHRVRSKYPDAVIVLAGMRMPDSMGQDYAESFHAVYTDLAKRNQLTLIPFLLDGVAGDPDLNQGDSIHPTAAGAMVVANMVWKIILPLLGPNP